MLESLRVLPAERFDNMAIILQQTYSENDPDYTHRVRECAHSLPCQTVVLTQFMNGTESAFLRLAADVFVHAIITDAFSASMQEYLYAGACVLKGAWLHYPQLAEMGIEVETFEDFSELPALLEGARAGTLTGLNAAQQALFPARYSWDAVRASWLGLYE
ncbi:MAG: hypothetical protein RR816_02105 [Clostridia bacterium]